MGMAADFTAQIGTQQLNRCLLRSNQHTINTTDFSTPILPVFEPASVYRRRDTQQCPRAGPEQSRTRNIIWCWLPTFKKSGRTVSTHVRFRCFQQISPHFRPVGDLSPKDTETPFYGRTPSLNDLLKLILHHLPYKNHRMLTRTVTPSSSVCDWMVHALMPFIVFHM